MIIYFLIYIILNIERKSKIKGSIKLGYYYLDIFVGSKNKKESLIIDTASSLTIISSKNSSYVNNFRPIKNFNELESDSKSFLKCDYKTNNFNCNCQNNKCAFSTAFMENSIYNGYYLKDTIKFRNELNSNAYNNKFIFGLANVESGLWYSQDANGILGLNNKTDQFNFISQFENITKTNTNISFCFSENGGYIIFNKNKKNKKNIFPKIILNLNDNNNLYGLNFTKFAINNQIVYYENYKNINKETDGSFLDSGSTYIIVSEDLKNNIISTLLEQCKIYPFNCPESTQFSNFLCFNYNNESLFDYFMNFPTINLIFENNKVIPWLPSDYLFFSNNKKYCLGIYAMKNLILGAIFWKNFEINIDFNTKKVIFQRKLCKKENFDYIKFYKEYFKKYKIKKLLKFKKAIKAKKNNINIFWIIFTIIIIYFIIIFIIVYLSRTKDKKEKINSHININKIINLN